MSHEETIVRTAYAKLSYAVDLETVYQAASHANDLTDLADRVSRQALKFQISNFTVGQISDIATENFMRRFPEHAGDGQGVIHTQLHKHNYTENGGPAVSMETLGAKWGAPPSSRGATSVLMDYTVSEWIPILQAELGVPHLVSYCMYTVTVSFDGRSRTYPAAFFFDKDGNAAADDTVVGGDGNNLQYFLQHPVYPKVLLAPTVIAAKPAVRAYLAASQENRPSCKSGDACCDTETMQCGVLASDIAAESADAKSGRQP